MFGDYTNYVARLSEEYGWPMHISCDDYDAYLCGIQRLNAGEQPLPVYRFPGGPRLVFMNNTELNEAARPA